MKKTYSVKLFFAVLFAALFSTAAAEKVVTFSPATSAATQNAAYTLSKDGVTVDVSNGTVTQDQFRVFKSSTMTVASTAGNITGITLTATVSGSEKYGPGCFEGTGYTFEDKVGTWAGSATSVTLTASSNQVRITELTVTLDGEATGGTTGGGTQQPTVNYKYQKASTFAAGKEYLLVADGNVAKPVTRTYGYLYVENVTPQNGVIILSSKDNAFVFEALPGEAEAVAIKQVANGNYLYMKDNYTSFNVAADPSEGGNLWLVTPNNDGSFQIMNRDKQKYIQYNAEHTSYGAYDVENGVMPELYEYVGETQEGTSQPGGGNEGGGGTEEPQTSFTVPALDTTPAGQNILKNGDFEAWTEGKADNWETFSSAGNATQSLSTDAHGGSSAVLVAATASTNKRLGYKELTLAAGTYKMSFFAKGGQARPGYVPVDNTGKAGSYKYGDYMTLSADSWTEVAHEFTLEEQTTLSIVVMNPKTNTAEGKEYESTDLIIDDFSLVKTEGGTVTPEPTPENETIATLNALTANKSNVSLKLTNAQVVYVDAIVGADGNVTGTNYYVREGDKAIMFYNISSFGLRQDAILNGTVNVDYVYYCTAIPEVKENASSTLENITMSAGAAAQPVEATVGEILNNQHVCDYIVLKSVSVVKDGNNYYAVDVTGARVQLYKGLDVSALADDGNVYDITAVFNNYYNNAPEIQPIAAGLAGVAPLTAPVFEPAAGTYNGQVTVSITASNPDYIIYYTTDGSEPAPGNGTTMEYAGEFTLTATTTVKAVAEDFDGELSPLAEATYTIITQGADGYGLPFTEAFNNGIGSFSINDTTLPEGVETIWVNGTYQGDNFIKVTSYVNRANQEAESWLISPVINMKNVQGATLTFEHAINGYFGTVEEEATAWIREAGQNQWQPLAISYPEKPASGYSSFLQNVISLNSYAGKSIEVAFRYIGHATSSGTWEIKNFSIEDNGGVAPLEAPTFSPASGTYDNEVTVTIEAARGAIYYTLDGSEPTPASTAYTEPFVLTQSATVKAAAFEATGAQSPVATATYTINKTIADGVDYTVDFTDPENGLPFSTNDDQDAGNIQKVTISGITFNFFEDPENVRTHARLWASVNSETGEVTSRELRFYKNQRFTIGAPAGYKILGITFYAQFANNFAFREEGADADLVGQKVEENAEARKLAAPAALPGNYRAVWVPAVPVNTGAFTASDNSRLTAVDVVLDSEIVNVNLLTGEQQRQAIYDLQGRRVQQATKGIFIVGGKKVLR